MAAPSAAMFPAAGACAELLLARSKDEVYESELKNLLREVLERCCGAHLLSQLLPELSALAAALYYLLALGRTNPKQTLGEEFCDVMRVTTESTVSGASAGNDAAASALERIAHVKLPRQVLWLALALLPQYIAARSQSGWLNLAQLTRSPRERMEQQLRNRQAAARDSNSGTAEPQSVLAALKPQSLLKQLDRLVTQLKALVTHVETEILPASYAFSFMSVQTWAKQLHLATFYVFAKYLDVAKRVSKTQYVFVRSDLAPGINLSLLGYMMALRLMVTAGVEAKRLRRHVKQDAKHKQVARAGLDPALYTQQSDRVPTAVSASSGPPSETASDAASQRRGPRRKCALCLGDRISPAATPCGHVFCWECIVGWCQKNKAECPLCRQETHPQQIKCIYNYV